MSFILNALRKAENKSLESDSVKIKKQVLVLKQRTRGKKIKIFSLLTIFLGTLCAGWLLGHSQNPQLDNITGLAGGILPSTSLHNEVENKQIQKTENKIDEVNPPIPVRGTNQVETPRKEDVQHVPEPVERKHIEEPLQNYSNLPALIKQQLPPIEISLHFYNSNPARRLVRINGKILHEKDSIQDRLTVEQIKPTTTVLNYDGHLFELNAPGG